MNSLLELECGLRKRERELVSILQQRDRKIMEQSHIIRFLTKKTGKTKTKIRSLADEAAAKIPQWSSTATAAAAVDHILEKTKGGNAAKAVTPHQPVGGGGGSAVTQITPGGSKSNSKKPVETSSAEVTLSSIMESEESENDSAVILDELASPTSKSSSSGCVSRSVSDVMSSEAELEKTNLPEISPFASPNYRGFLLRHGSYERYKIRSRMQQISHAGQPHHDPNAAQDTTSKEIYQEYSNQVTANATLPRNRKQKNRKAEQRELLDSRQTSLSAQDLSQSVTKAPNISNATAGIGNGVAGSGNTTTVIVINGCNNNNSNIKSSQNGQINAINSANSNNNNTNIEASSTHCKAASNSHRTVTKPRDVKNKSNNRTSKMQILKTTTTSTTMTTTVRQLPDDCKPPSPPPMGSHLGSPMIVTSDKFIQQSGSVYCSLYGIDMSEDELSYA